MATEQSEDDILRNFFIQNVQQNPNIQTSILAMETIIKAIEIDRTSNTLLEFFQKLEHVQKLVQNVPEIPHKMSIKSGTELLKLATTRMALDIIQEESDINKVKETLINRGNECIKMMKTCRSKAANEAKKFIPDGATILTHGHSRAVVEVVRQASSEGKLKRLYVTKMTNGSDAMVNLLEEMRKNGVECYEILTRSAAYVMERVDIVLLGAEAVVESGAVVSAMGSYGIAIAAHVHKIPFYIICESFKFIRSYPMKQSEVDQKHKYLNGDEEHPEADLTPARFVTLLITDLGALTPPAVSHHLIKLYT